MMNSGAALALLTTPADVSTGVACADEIPQWPRESHPGYQDDTLLPAEQNGDQPATGTVAAQGHILAIRGPVLDVAFPPGQLPGIGEALQVDHPHGSLFLEVHRILDARTVRTVALGHTDGLARGLTVGRTGRAMQVPVGPATLGRMFNMLGQPIDGLPPPPAAQLRSIYRPPTELGVSRQRLKMLPTGIKVIDLLAPVAQAGTTGVIGGAGVGKTVMLHELSRAGSCREEGVVVFAGVGERSREGNDLWLEMAANGTLARSVLVLGQMSEPAGMRLRVALTALTMAEFFRDVEDKNVLFVVDSMSRYLQASCEVSGLMGQLPSEMGYQPTLASDLGVIEERITATAWYGLTSVQAIYVPADDMTDPAVAQAFVHLDTSIILSRARAARGLYPAIDPIASSSRLLDPAQVGERHFQVAMRVKQTIERYRELEDIITMLGMQELRQEDRQAVQRARRLERFLSQPLFVAESFTGRPGQHVSLEDTLTGCEAILEGKLDGVDERQLEMIGAITEVLPR